MWIGHNYKKKCSQPSNKIRDTRLFFCLFSAIEAGATKTLSKQKSIPSLRAAFGPPAPPPLALLPPLTDTRCRNPSTGGTGP